MRSAVPQKLRFGKAFRKSVINALISSRPRRGSCSEYCRSMSGAASSSTMLRSQLSPQKLVNQRPTIALLSDSFDMVFSLLNWCLGIGKGDVAYAPHFGSYRHLQTATLRLLPL